MAELVGKAKNTVRDICADLRREYTETLIKQSLTDREIAEEVQGIMQSRLLRNLYPAYAEVGELLTRPKKYAA